MAQIGLKYLKAAKVQFAPRVGWSSSLRTRSRVWLTRRIWHPGALPSIWRAGRCACGRRDGCPRDCRLDACATGRAV